MKRVNKSPSYLLRDRLEPIGVKVRKPLEVGQPHSAVVEKFFW